MSTAKPAPLSLKSMNEDVTGLKANVAEISNTLDQVVAVSNSQTEILQEIRRSLAKDHPVISNKYLEGDEQYMGAEGNSVMSEDSTGNQILTVPDGTHVDDPLFNEKMKMEQFNEGFVEVHIQDRPDEQMPQVFEICVNGIAQIFTHGTTVKVKRKFVEGLARAKPSKFGNEEKNNSQTGEKEYVYPVSKGLKYPFALVNPTPLEAQWIRSVQAQP